MNQYLQDPYLDSMNFLNEACLLYPDAISFGSGRPKEDFFHLDDVVSGVKRFAKNLNNGKPLDSLGQYNMTKGIINDSITKLLKNDEGIIVSPEDIIITDGAQEAMAILIDTLFEKNDVLIVTDPSYIGFIGYAKIAGIDIRVVKRTETGIDFNDLEYIIKQVQSENKKVTALYEVPDFHNPTGVSMPVEERKTLLSFAQKYDFYIVEDNPYGYYCYDGERLPTLKSLDTCKKVIYIGSMSKSVFPSLRIGYLVVDQEEMINGEKIKLSEACKKVKSFMTVNTSTLLQAMLGTILAENDYSLINYCADKVAYCKNNRDVLAEVIESEFDFCGEWKKPSGGYFTILNIPFEPTDAHIFQAARDYGVIVCPLKMLCMQPENGKNAIRLSFSQLTPEDIKSGMLRLKKFLIDTMNKKLY